MKNVIATLLCFALVIFVPFGYGKQSAEVTVSVNIIAMPTVQDLQNRADVYVAMNPVNEVVQGASVFYL